MKFYSYNKKSNIYQGFAISDSKPFDNCTELEPSFVDGSITKFINDEWIQEEIIIVDVDPLQELKELKLEELEIFINKQKLLIEDSTIEELENLKY